MSDDVNQPPTEAGPAATSGTGRGGTGPGDLTRIEGRRPLAPPGAHDAPQDGPPETRSRRGIRLAADRWPDPARVAETMRQYWNSLRQGRAVPDRADVEPRGIREVLDYAFILERIAPGAARFRLAGSHLVDLMGMEVRGMPVCSVLNPDSRGRFSDVLESVFKAPQTAELTLRAEASYGRPVLVGRMLLLPLKSDLGDVTRALGCLATQGQIGRGPRRFDMTGDTVAPLIQGARALPPGPGATGFGEEPLPWRPPMLARPPREPLRPDATPEERRARFRVIEGPED